MLKLCTHLILLSLSSSRKNTQLPPSLSHTHICSEEDKKRLDCQSSDIYLCCYFHRSLLLLSDPVKIVSFVRTINISVDVVVYLRTCCRTFCSTAACSRGSSRTPQRRPTRRTACCGRHTLQQKFPQMGIHFHTCTVDTENIYSNKPTSSDPNTFFLQ